ncbi:hypothetical protein SAMN05421503_0127 [Terribacillus aidingensis]|uniref:Uncharacterized protein n=1 Tax=Terribacillus aidingensis TaxID=586416 RepID=A0A285MZ79_9BACI|nr:hypothetical protein [Terribacillus aidingensis]SNZ02510.1 hypothetical protein SAMN05421503_0127 [Terribacillus aidingensis]
MISKPDLKGMALTGLSFRWGKGVLAGFLLYLMFGFLIVFLSILSIPFLYSTDINNLNLVSLCISVLLFYTLLMPLPVGTSWFYLSHLWTYPYYKSTRASFYEAYIKRDLTETDVKSS